MGIKFVLTDDKKNKTKFVPEKLLVIYIASPM